MTLTREMTPEEMDTVLRDLEYKVEALRKQANAPRGGWYRLTITVPLKDEVSGARRWDVHAKVQEMLRSLSGGETHTYGGGTYIMDDATVADDEGYTYSTLIDTGFNMEQDFTLRNIARYVGRELHQESVLCTYERIDGGVMFIRPDSIDNID